MPMTDHPDVRRPVELGNGASGRGPVSRARSPPERLRSPLPAAGGQTVPLRARRSHCHGHDYEV